MREQASERHVVCRRVLGVVAVLGSTFVAQAPIEAQVLSPILTLRGPVFVGPLAPVRFTGELQENGTGVPAQPIDVIVDGILYSTVLTDASGQYTGDISFQPGHRTVEAAWGQAASGLLTSLVDEQRTPPVEVAVVGSIEGRIVVERAHSQTYDAYDVRGSSSDRKTATLDLELYPSLQLLGGVSWEDALGHSHFDVAGAGGESFTADYGCSWTGSWTHHAQVFEGAAAGRFGDEGPVVVDYRPEAQPPSTVTLRAPALPFLTTGSETRFGQDCGSQGTTTYALGGGMVIGPCPSGVDGIHSDVGYSGPDRIVFRCTAQYVDQHPYGPSLSDFTATGELRAVVPDV